MTAPSFRYQHQSPGEASLTLSASTEEHLLCAQIQLGGARAPQAECLSRVSAQASRGDRMDWHLAHRRCEGLVPIVQKYGFTGAVHDAVVYNLGLKCTLPSTCPFCFNASWILFMERIVYGSTFRELLHRPGVVPGTGDVKTDNTVFLPLRGDIHSLSKL